MPGTNPDIVFDDNRESVAPGGQDYSILRDMAPSPEVEQQREAPPPVAATEPEKETIALAANRPEIGAFMGVDVTGTFTHTGHADARAEVTDYENGPHRPGAPAVTLEAIQPDLPPPGDQQVAEQPAQDTITQPEPVAVADTAAAEQAQEAVSMRQAAEESTKRQEAELPGAENVDNGLGATSTEAEPARLSFRESLAIIQSEHSALAAEPTNEAGQEAGHEGPDGAAAAFRGFGGR